MLRCTSLRSRVARVRCCALARVPLPAPSTSPVPSGQFLLPRTSFLIIRSFCAAPAAPPQPSRLRRGIWRVIRAARVGFLAIAIYHAGKASGHVEVLEDPDGVQKQLVGEYIVNSHSGECEPGLHRKDSPPRLRIERIGRRIVHAAHDEVTRELQRAKAELENLEERSRRGGLSREETVSKSPLEERVAELSRARKRLSGTWHFILTNSEGVNAFVTPHCPRCVFVHEGLLDKLEPTDDELAYLMGHEIGHVVHAHAQQSIDERFNFATLQLVVFSLIDPTGLLPLLFTGAIAVALSAETQCHSREHEAEADATGMRIVARACYDCGAGATMMHKMGGGDEGQARSGGTGWFDTHPSCPEREEALQHQASKLMAPDGVAHACHETKMALGAVDDMPKKKGLWR